MWFLDRMYQCKVEATQNKIDSNLLNHRHADDVAAKHIHIFSALYSSDKLYFPETTRVQKTQTTVLIKLPRVIFLARKSSSRITRKNIYQLLLYNIINSRYFIFYYFIFTIIYYWTRTYRRQKFSKVISPQAVSKTYDCKATRHT